MSAQHTPGPWKVEVKESGENIYSPFASIVGPRAQVHWSAGYNTKEFDARSRAEALANAALISAAPELLQALEHVLAYGEEYEWSESLHKEVSAAIAKATGATP